jgi:cytochrome c-type biogenesis protein CcmH
MAFVAIAATLVLAVTVWVAWPLWRGARGAAVGTAIVLLAGTAVLYGWWSNWSWDSPTAGEESPAAMVARLARRLERKPDDLEGWLMLGRSYTVLEQYPLAVRAFQRADRLADGRNAEALAGWAEALTLVDENELTGRAGRLFERALELEPQSGKALFFAGVAAQRRGDLALARDRFSALLALGPPDNVRPILQQQVEALDAELALGQGKAAAGAAATSPSGVNDTPRINLEIGIAPALAAHVPSGASLFVAVRRPGEPGPPLAARRLTASFPQRIELTPADAMMPGRTFAAGETVVVVARVARSGQPIAQPGDPYGEVRYAVGRDALKPVVIDRLTP